MGYRTAFDVTLLLLAVALGRVQMVVPSALPSESEVSCSGLLEADVARARSLLALPVDRGLSAGNISSIHPSTNSSIHSRKNHTEPFGNETQREKESLWEDHTEPFDNETQWEEEILWEEWAYEPRRDTVGGRDAVGGRTHSRKRYSGRNAPLSQRGYQAVVEAESDTEMKQFILRLCKAMHLKVLDDGVVSGLVPYYSGVKGIQSFENLKAELKRGSKSSLDHQPWLTRATSATGSDLLSAVRTKGRSKALLALQGSVSGSTNTSSSMHSKNNGAPFGLGALFASSFGSKQTGKTAPLNSQGYQNVVEAKSNEEMKQFILRLVKAMHLKVLDKGVLNGFVPYYSGVEDVQSFQKLRSELISGLKLSGQQKPWLAREKSLTRVDLLKTIKQVKQGRRKNKRMP